MDPSQPSQPATGDAYSAAGNPADQNREERRQASTRQEGGLVDARERGDVPVRSTHGYEGQPSSMGYGTRTGEGDRPDGKIGASDTEGEKLATFGEGEVASAQQNKSGFGEQMDLASDLDRKKAEQAQAREAVKDQRQRGVDVSGALGDRGGPAVADT